MRDLVARGFSGQVVVARGKTILLDSSFGFADRDRIRRVTAATLFDVASVTKTFTAAAILRLRDAHLLSLSSRIAEHFTAVPSDKASITVSQLLLHTSGLSNTYPASGVTDRDEAVQRVLDQPLADAPGAGFHYSDDNYLLLAAIIETRSRTDYEQFLRSQLFVPAGLKRTVFWGQVDFTDPSQLASFHRSLPPFSLRRHWGQLGSGGVLATAFDLYLWWKALNEGLVLPRQTVTDLLSVRQRLSSGTGVALGWFCSPSKSGDLSVWARGNEDWGHNAILYAIPSAGYVIAVTSNSGSIDDEPWSRRVRDEVETLLVGEASTGSNPAGHLDLSRRDPRDPWVGIAVDAALFERPGGLS